MKILLILLIVIILFKFIAIFSRSSRKIRIEGKIIYKDENKSMEPLLFSEANFDSLFMSPISFVEIENYSLLVREYNQKGTEKTIFVDKEKFKSFKEGDEFCFYCQKRFGNYYLI